MRLGIAQIALSIAAMLSSSAVQAQSSAQKLSVVANSRAAPEVGAKDARLAGVPTLWLVIGAAAIVGILFATEVIDFGDDEEDSVSR
jgi:hypothetical protein